MFCRRQQVRRGALPPFLFGTTSLLRAIYSLFMVYSENAKIRVRYLSFPRYSTKIYFLQPKPPTIILAVRDSQEDTPLRRATYSEFPPSSLCADHGLRKSETRAFTHTNQFVRSWLFLTCFM